MLLKATTSTGNMILCRDLHKQFKRARVLNGIDLEFDRGDRVALIGSNGAGKTTLIRCLLGQYTYEGEVSVTGLDPRRQRGEVLRNVGFVPQLPPPLKMPVGLLIEFSAALCDTDPANIRAIAERLGLDTRAIAERQFVRLSGGMKQKILIAIALGRQATVLLMDEPAANLDPEARKIFFDLLAERQHETTMIISSHRLDEVAALVNRVVELDTGKVVLDDRVAEDVSLSGRLDCVVVLKRPEPALARALAAWEFRDLSGGMRWEGQIAGADRLRFVSMVSRYLAVIDQLSLGER